MRPLLRHHPVPSIRPSIRTTLLSLLIALVLTAGARGQAVPPPRIAVPGPDVEGGERKWFRIGYLRPDADAVLGRRWYQDLKRELLDDSAFRNASRETGITGVALRPCDGADDMLQRMGQNEFEMVICPAMVYAQSRLADPGRYRVLFQTRRVDVDRADTRGDHVRRRGVVFVPRGGPLDRPDIPAAQLRTMLDTTRMAVSGSYDAAGFFYVRKMMLEDYDGTRPGDFLYCGSAENVVKNVVSGLADVGACEEGALLRAFRNLPPEARADIEFQDGANRFVRIILRTDWVPTDPVAIRSEYDPRYRRSPVGQAAASVFRRVYNASDIAPRLEPAQDDAYDRMADDVRLTPHLTRGEGW